MLCLIVVCVHKESRCRLGVLGAVLSPLHYKKCLTGGESRKRSLYLKPLGCTCGSVAVPRFRVAPTPIECNLPGSQHTLANESHTAVGSARHNTL